MALARHIERLVKALSCREETHTMALIMVTRDLPPDERLAAYNEKVGTEWVPSVLQQPGVMAVRGYRNPHHTTPQVMVHMEFDSLASWQRFLASERYGELMFELRTLGCTNRALHVWDASPLVPDPVLPPGG
jgi:hypothetical protein